MSNINIDEVSFVDRPANMQPFLFAKRADTIEKAKPMNLDVSFSTDGMSANTSLKVNGKTINNVIGMGLYYAPMGDDVAIQFSYTVQNKQDNPEGFSASKTFMLSKNIKNIDDVEETDTNTSKIEKAFDDDLKIIKSLIDIEDELVDAEFAKAVASHVCIINEYKADMPNDLVAAIAGIVKLAVESEFEKEEENDMAEKEGKTEDTKETPKLDMSVLVERVVEAVVPKVTSSVMEALEQRDTAAKETEQKQTEEAAAAADEGEEITPEELGEMIATATDAAVNEAVAEAN